MSRPIPVRVHEPAFSGCEEPVTGPGIRSHQGHGLYWVDSYWREPGLNGCLICRFRLVKRPKDQGDVSRRQDGPEDQRRPGPSPRSIGEIRVERGVISPPDDNGGRVVVLYKLHSVIPVRIVSFLSLLRAWVDKLQTRTPVRSYQPFLGEYPVP